MKTMNQSRGLRPVNLCSTCGRNVHSWRGGWRHARGHAGAAPVDHAVTGPVGPGEWLTIQRQIEDAEQWAKVDANREREALRRALGRG